MSLLFPAYLLGLLGLSLPWLLHRFSDQEAQETLFPTGRFLEETAPPVSRTRTLKYRVLMAIRVLSLLLLCFLFAQPWLTRTDDLTGAKQHHIIAIDLSLSMRATDRWENALMSGRELIEELGDSYSVELVAFDESMNRIADNSESVTDLNRGLFGLQPGYGRADYGIAMQRLNRLAADRDEPVKVWIITDQQQSAMPAQSNALYAPRVSEFEIVSTVNEPQRNVHLKASAFSDDGVNVRVSVQLSASVSMPDGAMLASERGSLLPARTVRVSFDETVLAQREVSLEDTDVKTVVFDDIIMPPGLSPVLVVSMAETDALLADNRVSAIIQQANPAAVALLQSDSRVTTNASIFLTTALETDSLADVSIVEGTTERVDVQIAHVVSGRDLVADKIDTDILLYVESGNNALLFSNLPSGGRSSSLIKGVEVGLVDESHPMDLGSIDWFGVEFFDVSPIQILDGDRVLIETTDRQAILVEREVRGGKLLLLNDQLSGQGSNLPLQPAFVSLMQSVIAYFDASAALPDTLFAGEKIVVSGNVQLLDPNNQPQLPIDQNLRVGGYQVNEPGLYKVIGIRGTHTINVQLDSQEADLGLADGTALANWRSRFDKVQATTSEIADEPLSESGLDEMSQAAKISRSTLWRWLLPVLLAALMIENMMANRRLNVRRDGS